MNLTQQYRITQIVLRKFVKKYFKEDIKIKMCSFRYFDNRTLNIWNMPYRERIWIYSKLELNDTQKKDVELFLIDKFQNLEVSITGHSDREIIGIECVFVSPV
jgi:hypothetical protein